MESAEQQLRASERVAVTPFLTGPRSPWWSPVLMASFFTAMTAGPVLVDWRLGLSTNFVMALAITWVYDRSVYPRAAQRVRDRLA